MSVHPNSLFSRLFRRAPKTVRHPKPVAGPGSPSRPSRPAA